MLWDMDMVPCVKRPEVYADDVARSLRSAAVTARREEGRKGGMEHMQSKIYSLFVRYMDGTDVHS